MSASSQIPQPTTRSSSSPQQVNLPALKDGEGTYGTYKQYLEATGNTTQEWNQVPSKQKQAWNELYSMNGRKLYSMWQLELAGQGESAVEWRELGSHQQQSWNQMADALNPGAKEREEEARRAAEQKSPSETDTRLTHPNEPADKTVTHVGGAGLQADKGTGPSKKNI